MRKGQEKRDRKQTEYSGLDVGCGDNKYPGSIGIDQDILSQADVVCDLERGFIPFKDAVFGKILLRQVLEHMGNAEAVLKEICRIAQDKAKIIIETPHFSSYLSYGDFGHKHSCSVFILDAIASRLGLVAVQKKITFHKALRRYGIHFFANWFPRQYERFWSFILPAEHIHFEFVVNKTGSVIHKKERTPDE